MTSTYPQRTWNASGNLSIGEVLRLPSTVDVTTAGRALGFGRSKAYALVRAGTFPCRVIRAGETYRVPTPEIFALLGIDLAGLTDGRAPHTTADHDA